MYTPAKELKQEPLQENPLGNLGDNVSWDSDLDVELSPSKRQRVESVLPVGFLDPLTPEERLALQRPIVVTPQQLVGRGSTCLVRSEQVSDKAKVAVSNVKEKVVSSCKQFWKAGDYEVTDAGHSNTGFC